MGYETIITICTSVIAVYYYLKYQQMRQINQDVSDFVVLLMSSRSPKEIQDAKIAPF